MIENIPLRLRKVLYIFPAFLTWLIGYTWEHDENARKAAVRGYGLFLMFIAGTALVFILTEILTLISGKLNLVSGVIGLVFQAFVSLGYTLLSLFLAYLEYRGDPYTLPIVDTLMDKLSGFLENP
jgi:uncharacterized membrane protein